MILPGHNEGVEAVRQDGGWSTRRGKSCHPYWIDRNDVVWRFIKGAPRTRLIAIWRRHF